MKKLLPLALLFLLVSCTNDALTTHDAGRASFDPALLSYCQSMQQQQTSSVKVAQMCHQNAGYAMSNRGTCLLADNAVNTPLSADCQKVLGIDSNPPPARPLQVSRPLDMDKVRQCQDTWGYGRQHPECQNILLEYNSQQAQLQAHLRSFTDAKAQTQKIQKNENLRKMCQTGNYAALPPGSPDCKDFLAKMPQIDPKVDVCLQSADYFNQNPDCDKILSDVQGTLYTLDVYMAHHAQGTPIISQEQYNKQVSDQQSEQIRQQKIQEAQQKQQLASCSVHIYGHPEISASKVKIFAFYFVPNDRQQMANYRDIINKRMNDIRAFHLREFSGLSALDFQVGTITGSQPASYYRKCDDQYTFWNRVVKDKPVQDAIFQAKQTSGYFPVVLLLTDTGCESGTDNCKKYFQYTCSNHTILPDECGGSAAVFFNEKSPYGVSVVTPEAWKYDVGGGEGVVYHEGVGHALNLPHPAPIDKSVMGTAQYSCLDLKNEWLNKGQIAAMTFCP